MAAGAGRLSFLGELLYFTVRGIKIFDLLQPCPESLGQICVVNLDRTFKIIDEGVVARFSAFRKLYYAMPPHASKGPERPIVI